MNNLSPRLEAYLEAIFRLEKKHGVARVKDIAKSLSVRMPSVSGALKILKEKELVNYRKNSFITLTDSGIELAETIVFKHHVIEEFLKNILSVDPEKAFEEACGIKHVISIDTAVRIKKQFGLNDSVLEGIILLRARWEGNG